MDFDYYMSYCNLFQSSLSLWLRRIIPTNNECVYELNSMKFQLLFLVVWEIVAYKLVMEASHLHRVSNHLDNTLVVVGVIVSDQIYNRIVWWFFVVGTTRHLTMCCTIQK